VRPEVLFQRGSQRGGHGCPGPGILPGEDPPAAVGQPEEAEDLVVARPGVSEEVAAVDDVDPVPAEHALQVIQLVSVVAAGAVGEVVKAEALVARFGHDALRFTFHP
jgi:hypothetical protein